MTEEYAASRYEEACALLPSRLRTAALALPLRQKAEIEELRLRIGRQAFLTLPDGEVPLQHTMVTRSDLEQVLDKATEYSRYTASETIRHGYVTAAGGFRVGLCGTALPGGEINEGVRDISSLAIRIPRVREGASLPRCWRESGRTRPEPLGKLLLPLGPLLPEGGGPLAQAVEETREELTGFLREETARQASQGRINAALSMAGACLAILVLL